MTSSPTSCLVLPVSYNRALNCYSTSVLHHLAGTAFKQKGYTAKPSLFPSIKHRVQTEWGKRPLSLGEGHSYHCSGNLMPASWHERVSNKWYHNSTFTCVWAEYEGKGRKRESFTHFSVKTATDNTYTSILFDQMQVEITFSYVNVLWVPRNTPCFWNTNAEGRHKKSSMWFKMVVVLWNCTRFGLIIIKGSPCIKLFRILNELQSDFPEHMREVTQKKNVPRHIHGVINNTLKCMTVS